MNAQLKVLEPVAGLSREVGLMVAGLEIVRAQTNDLLSDLTAHELAVRFAPNANQIGGLALHLAECEFWWIEAGFAKKEISDEDRRFAHLYDTTETDFALKRYQAEDCIDVLAKVHSRTVQTLTECTDDDLDAVFVNDLHPSGFRGSLRWILNRLIDHEANHKGQIAMMKRMIREGKDNG